MPKRLFLCFGLAALLGSPEILAQNVSLEFVEGTFSLSDMSPDGRFHSGSSSDGLPIIWDAHLNVTTELPGGLNAVAISDDGNTVFGSMENPDTPGTSIGSVAGIWTTATQSWESIGHLPDALNCPSRSSPYEISANGSVGVGLSWDGCNALATRWTEETGMVAMQELGNGSNRASVVSADGNVIAGFAQGSFSRTPAVWNGQTGAGELLDPPDGDALGEILGISDDGSTLLGTYAPNEGPGTGLATRWTGSFGAWTREQIGSGSFRPGWQGIPHDISDDGTIIGFDILPGSLVRRGWIALPGEEIQELNQWLVANGVEIPINPSTGAPEVLEVPQAISSNGRVIVGHGGPFSIGGWRITISSPCDFDADLDCDLTDIDALIDAIATGSGDLQFDLDGDGVVGLSDRDEWLLTAGEENLGAGIAYLLGDANLDGVVDVSDFNVWNGNKFSATGAWSLGDFSADGNSDVSDFNIWNANKFTSSSLVVPEPSSILLAWSFLVVAMVRRRS